MVTSVFDRVTNYLGLGDPSVDATSSDADAVVTATDGDANTDTEAQPQVRRDGTAARGRIANDPRAQLLQSRLQRQTDKPWASDRDWSKASEADINDLQTQLKAAGHNPGDIDGVWGPKTRSATQAARAELPSALLERTGWDSASSADVRSLQEELQARGQSLGAADGIWGPKTEAALTRARAKVDAGQTVPDPRLETVARQDNTRVARPQIRDLDKPVAAPAAETGLSEERQAMLTRSDWSTASRSEVRGLQTELTAMGEDPGVIDGKYGGNTIAALNSAREKHGITPDPRHGDALVVVYPDYAIDPGEEAKAVGKQLGLSIDKVKLGHADVVTWEDGEGGKVRPMLHQYGRYASKQGEVRSQRLPITLDVDPETKDLTPESRTRLLEYLSANHGHGTRIEAAEIEDIDLNALEQYVGDRRAQNNDPNREAYSVYNNHCTTFAWAAAQAGTFNEDTAAELKGRGQYSLPEWSMRGVSDVADRISWTPTEGIKEQPKSLWDSIFS